MSKLCFVVAAPLSLRVFMRNHILELAKLHDVTAVADFSEEELKGTWLPGVRLVSIPIARQINLVGDVRALLALLRFFRRERFDVVHSITPKAGLLAMLAARLSGVRHRIHCFTGQVWATKTGLGRTLLKNADRVIAASANHILTDSLSQRSFLEQEGVLSPGRADVLGQGSIAGVDLERFTPDHEMRRRTREAWGVPPEACLLLFVGRLNLDKGILDLARAFALLAHERADIWLAVVGPDEADIAADFDALCGDARMRIYRLAYTERPQDAMAAADIFVLPSYREGFGNVVIEAAACGIPTVASNIYGLCDAVEENITGLLHPAGDIGALRDCLLRLCNDVPLRQQMGRAARARVQADFSMQKITQALITYYDNILHLDKAKVSC